MTNDASNRPLGLSLPEMEAIIAQRMNALDSAQEDQDQLGGYADLLRTATLIAYHRAAELIDANNARIAEQLAELKR